MMASTQPDLFPFFAGMVQRNLEMSSRHAAVFQDLVDMKLLSG
jgi:hypothetical protein